MTDLPPTKPLDGLITQFRSTVNSFLDREDFAVEPPVPTRRIPVLQVFKRQFSKAHLVWSNAEPRLRRQLQEISALGSAIVEIADDQFIVGPVREVMQRASEEQTDLSRITDQMGQADSNGATVLLIFKRTGFEMRTELRRKAITAALDSLTAYYVLQMPPREPDDPAS
ncbi:hypothetical protein BST33_15490 [Mycolicibacter minnesotensis]|uniref:Uncharacterized protein n=1 Tax=Mycolicibacter minnesotensis TaxID=1118379 RepID=A0A7I7R7W9_9MYCO|nr:hypothetical protein [Mycolicibacter minnesotensis]ORA98890.1 hypothetical protein BST33_15490 [Mycolicibacter minnesotensis]BBY34711.1 hypothetical protein MMIN_27720 [Mycolicibacter minnesotensis]